MKFRHRSNAQTDNRCVRLRSVLGWKGYGIYWGLIERLLKAPDYSLPCSEIKTIAYEFHVQPKTIKTIIDSFDLFEIFDSGARFRSNPNGIHTFPKR